MLFCLATQIDSRLFSNKIFRQGKLALCPKFGSFLVIFLFVQHSMEDVTKQKDFSLEGILDMNCNITSFQDNYFINSSFTHAKQQVRSAQKRLGGGVILELNFRKFWLVQKHGWSDFIVHFFSNNHP